MVAIVTIYLIIALVCGILLMVMALFGGDFLDLDMDVDTDVDMDMGHFEAGHGDFSAGLSPLSLPIILAFGTSFGAFGVIFDTLGFSVYVTPLFSGILSVAIAGVIFVVILKVFVETQAATRVNLKQLVGKEGVVSIPIKPGEQGQIMTVTEERGRTLITAISEDEEIPTDSVVTIEKIIGNTAVVAKKK
jgi:membrane protein implicated in regulation of membrane protease activity